MLAHRTILASVLVVWVVPGGLGHWWMVMLDCRAILVSVLAVWVVLGVMGQ